MFAADQKGKLSLHEQVSEDFLTSAVFSVLNYLGGPWMEQFISSAVDFRGQQLSLQMPCPIYDFWPWFDNAAELGHGAEPDLARCQVFKLRNSVIEGSAFRRKTEE